MLVSQGGLQRSLSTKSAEELIAIIEHMSKVADKIRTENESLRKSTVTQTKYMELLSELKRLKTKKQESEKSHEINEATTKLEHIGSENSRIRKQLNREAARTKELSAKVEELSASKEELLKEVVSLRKAIAGLDMPSAAPEEISDLKKQIFDLQKLVDDKETLIKNLMKPDSSEQARLMGENRRLMRELEIWMTRANKLSETVAQKDLGIASYHSNHIATTEKQNQQLTKRVAELEAEARDLRSTNPKIYEELDDLKHNYRECMKLNVLLEQKLKNLEGHQ